MLDGLPGGYAVGDGVGLLFAGTSLVEAVSARADARAHRIEERGGRLVETEIVPRLLEPVPAASHGAPVEIAEFRDARRRREARARRSHV